MSEWDSNMSSMMSWSVCFHFVTILNALQHSTQQTKHLNLRSLFKCLECLWCYMLLLWQGMDWTHEDRQAWNFFSNKLCRNRHSKMKDIWLGSHVALTSAMNICVHSFPLLLTVCELIFLSIWISLYYHKTKHQYKIETQTASDKILWHVQWAANYLAQSPHL